MWAISKRFSQSACHFFWYSSCLHWQAPPLFLFFYLRHIKYDKQDFFGILQVLTAIGNFCIISIAIGIVIEIIVMYPIQHRPYRQGINNLLVLLIGGIPIAMPTVLSVTMAIGSHRLSQQVLHFFSCFSSFVPLLFHHVGMSTHWQGHLTLADYRAGIVQVIMKLFAWTQGAITKRMTAIEEMAGMDVLCSDKTGTLTLNKLTVDKNLVEVN